MHTYICICMCIYTYLYIFFSTPESKNCVMDLAQGPFCISKSEFSVNAVVDHTSFTSVVISIVSFIQGVFIEHPLSLL